MNKIFVLSGASGVGKTMLLEKLVKKGICVGISKYSTRLSFNTSDDVIHVDSINNPNLECDLIYSMYGHKYGFSSKEIRMKLREKPVILISNDIKTIEKLHDIFPKRVIVIYIASDINKRILRDIYLQRYGVPSIEKKGKLLISALDECKNSVYENNGDYLLTCINQLNTILDDLVFEDLEFKLRLDRIEHIQELYLDDIFKYNYVVLNYYTTDNSYASDIAYKQLERIIKKEM